MKRYTHISGKILVDAVRGSHLAPQQGAARGDG